MVKNVQLCIQELPSIFNILLMLSARDLSVDFTAIAVQSIFMVSSAAVSRHACYRRNKRNHSVEKLQASDILSLGKYFT